MKSMDNAVDLVKALAAPLESANPSVSGDYYADDGILMCGKCHTPKRCRMEFHGETLLLPVICECAKEALAERHRREQQTEAAIRAAELRRLSMIDSKLSGCSFETAESGDNERSLNICRRYADMFSEILRGSRGLLLFGSVGTGKTYAAACIANALIARGYTVQMISLVNVINNDISERIGSVDLLILDDLGAERGTDYGYERVYAITDARYRSGKPVIYTTNLTLEELKNSPDIRAARIYDRVLERCFPVEFRGVSRRKREARKGFEEMKRLLEGEN